MSFEPPAGILDIGNATLRVGKLEVTETTGLNQGLQNIVKNDLLVTENNESSPYTTDQKWGLKLPTNWVGEFEVKGQTGKYIEFNFYNEGSTSNAQGYTLNFKDTSLTLKYDNGNNLATATIPTIVGTFRKVNIFFERGVIAISIDGTQYLYYKESDGFNNGLGVASRVVSATGGAFVNLFIQGDHSGNSQFKNLRIVNGRFISDKTSNISFIGSLGVGVNSPQEALDIRGNVHLNRVSNVSSVSVDSNVVTEYTGPHDRSLRKYPEIILPRSAVGADYNGYRIDRSSEHVVSGTYDGVQDLFNETAVDYADTWGAGWQGTSGAYSTSTGEHTTYVTGGTTQGTGARLASNVPNGEWVSLKTPNAIKLDNIQIRSRNAADWYAQFPSDFQIWGSNDGTTWSHVKTFTTQSAYAQNLLHTFPVNSTTFYNRHALVVTKIPGTAADVDVSTGHAHFSISELRFNAKEEGNASLDSTLKSVYNVPETTGTQLDVYYDGQDYSEVPTSITDKTGNGNHATTIGSGIGFDSTYKAFTFDGTSNGTIVGTHDFSVSAPILTISFWMKRTGRTNPTGWNYVATIGTSTNGQMIGLTINPQNQFNFSNYGDGTLTREPILLDQWYHVTLVTNGVATFNSDNFKMYINGKEPVLSSHGANTTTNLTGSQLTLGTNTSYGEAFIGSIANFRIYSKALNADQIKELYDYQKDFFLGSKSQLTLSNGHLGVGVDEASGQLELAGDERVQEYPPAPMAGTSTNIEGHGEFVATSSSIYQASTTRYQAWMGFNKAQVAAWDYNTYNGGDNVYSDSTGLYIGNQQIAGIKGDWVKLQFPYQIKLQSYELKVRGAWYKHAPDDWVLLGSNDDNNWETVDSMTSTASGTSLRTSRFPESSGDTVLTRRLYVNSTKYYRYLALVTTKLRLGPSPQNVDNINWAELIYYGTPGSTTLDKGSLSLGRSLNTPRISRYDGDTAIPRQDRLIIDFDTSGGLAGFSQYGSTADISGKGNHGIPGSSGSWSGWNPNDHAFIFNGSSDYIERDLLSEFVGDPTLTISMWVNPITLATANGQYDTFVHIGKNTADSKQLQISYYGYGGHLQLGGWGQSMRTNDASAAPIGEWTHICAVVKPGSWGTDTKKLYINGKLYPTTLSGSGTTAIPSADAGCKIVFGAVVQSSGNGFIHHANIKMSKPQIWDVALDPSEVMRVYNLGRTGRSMVISDTAVGIGKDPEAALDVRGDMIVRGMPRTPTRPVFYAYQAGGADENNGYTGQIYFSHTRINVGGCYAAGANAPRRFYAPITGYYWFECQVLAREGTGEGRVEITLYKNGSNISSRALAYTYLKGTSDHDNLAFSVPVYMNAGDNIYPGVYASDNTVNIYYGEDLAHFSGFFIG